MKTQAALFLPLKSASYSERMSSFCLLSVRLLQLHVDQHSGRGRKQRGAGRRLSTGGERALQQPAGEHAAERHPSSHQRLQQRSEVTVCISKQQIQQQQSLFVFHGKYLPLRLNPTALTQALAVCRSQHPERYLQLRGVK